MAANGQRRLFVPIEVFSDPLCPWSWIGKHSLEAALRRYEDEHRDVEFEVVWRPFCLNPLLKTKCDKLSFYNEWAVGANSSSPSSSPAAAASSSSSSTSSTTHRIDCVRAAGARYGLAFNISGTMGPSRPAQALIASVLQRRGAAAQARVVEALFRGHFSQGRDVSDEAWLARVAVDVAGIPVDVARADVRGWARAVADDGAEEAVEEHGVEAVPCVVVAGRYKVGGYQDEEVFVALLDRIRDESRRRRRGSGAAADRRGGDSAPG